jgi:hypothetical protein
MFDGPQSSSQSEQLAIIGRVIASALRIEEISPDKARRELLGLMPLPVVNMLLNAWLRPSASRRSSHQRLET